MILSNTAMFEALADGRLVIDPEPEPRYQSPGGDESPFGTSAVDLRLGPYISTFRTVPHAVIDLGRPGSMVDTLTGLSDSLEIGSDGYELEPGKLILAQTLETVSLRLPQELEGVGATRPTLAARVEGKSSRARIGLLVHFTAPTIHAGWSGRIALEVMCLGKIPIRLRRGVPICQLIVEQLVGVPSESPSQFQGQRTPTGASL